MIINAQLRCKQVEIQPVRCAVSCVVELSEADFYEFQFDPLVGYPFVKEHLPDLQTDDFHAIPCMLVLGENIDDGILVDPQGYDYARYTAYIPMARQLIQAGQNETESDELKNDLAKDVSPGMSL